MPKFLLDLDELNLNTINSHPHSKTRLTEAYSVNGNIEMTVRQSIDLQTQEIISNQLIIESLFKTDLKIIHEITQEDFKNLMEEFGLVLSKTNIAFSPNVKIDIYDRSYYGSRHDLAIMTINYPSSINLHDAEIYLTSAHSINIKLLDDVTNNAKYTNYKLAYLNKINQGK